MCSLKILWAVISKGYNWAGGSVIQLMRASLLQEIQNNLQSKILMGKCEIISNIVFLSILFVMMGFEQIIHDE